MQPRPTGGDEGDLILDIHFHRGRRAGQIELPKQTGLRELRNVDDCQATGAGGEESGLLRGAGEIAFDDDVADFASGLGVADDA